MWRKLEGKTVKWTGMIESLAAGEACEAISWPTPAGGEGTFESTGVSSEVTLI